MVLIMTVEPGFGGQKFLDLCLPKIRRARELMDKHGVETWLQVDGGVSLETIERCAEAGADVFVAGSAVYSADDPDRMVGRAARDGRGRRHSDGQTVPVLLTISTTHAPATRPRLPAAQAPRPGPGVHAVVRHRDGAVYPEATDERMHRRARSSTSTRSGWPARGRATRPTSASPSTSTTGSYAASSLLGVALADVFSTARSGRCDARQELADSAIPLEIEHPGAAVPRRRRRSRTGCSSRSAGRSRPSRSRSTSGFPEWGDSRYVRLRLTGTVRLADALNQLTSCCRSSTSPSTTGRGPTRSTSCCAPGRTGSPTHPERDLITRRYLGRAPALTRVALPGSPSSATRSRRRSSRPTTRRSCSPRSAVPLNAQRHDAVLPGAARARRAVGHRPRLRPGPAARRRCCKTRRSPASPACDVSTASLQHAARRLRARAR